MELIPAGRPLRSLTNSPQLLTQRNWKARSSVTTEHSLNIDEIGIHPSSFNNDGVYNAHRVASNEESATLAQLSLDTQPESEAVRHRLCAHTRYRARSEGEASGTKNLANQFSHSKLPAYEHCRGWSLNDLDCALDMHAITQKNEAATSLSSDEALEAAACTNLYPHMPRRPPPDRRATPEGIPSFGTPEAQKLRLVPPSKLYRLGNLIGKILHLAEPVDLSTRNAENTQDFHQLGHRAGRHDHSANPAEMLRRISGMGRPIPVAAHASKPRKVALPKGLRVASSPGDLAVAEDGSRVKGRFGYRVSGHSVGQRTVDLHPLARRHQSSAIEETVRAIGKACAHGSGREQCPLGSDASEFHPESELAHNHVENQVRPFSRILDTSAAGLTVRHEQLGHAAPGERREEHARLRATLRMHQAPAVTSSRPLPIFAPRSSHLHTSSSTAFYSVLAHEDDSNIDGSTTTQPHTVEPMVYSRSHFRPGPIQRDLLVSGFSEITAEEVQHTDRKLGIQAC